MYANSVHPQPLILNGFIWSIQRTAALYFTRVALQGGLCNLSMDRECRDLILDSGGIPLVTACLSGRREEIVLSAITTLMNLTTPASRPQVTEPAVVQCMLRFSLSESPRLRNLACVFLQDCCTERQVGLAQQSMPGGPQTVLGIPLPADSGPWALGAVCLGCCMPWVLYALGAVFLRCCVALLQFPLGCYVPAAGLFSSYFWES